MADSEKPKADRRPESPTTARELDFDDDDVPASPKVVKSSTGTETSSSAIPATTEEVPPPQPPRPLSASQQAENTLREAFPTIDAAVVKAVLVASGGNVEPAFNALLGMSDPDSQHEPAPPPQPPRPRQTTRIPPGQSQMEADALYARQLAEHYNGAAAYGAYERTSRNTSRDYRDPQLPRQKRETGLKPNELYDDRERSFIDDDLPIIRDKVRQGFLETQSKVNSFFTTLKKKIDGEDEEPPPRPTGRTQTGFSSGMNQGYGIRRGDDANRRSGDRDRYDADPQVLGDDFTTLELRDETTPRRTGRPLANPDLFKPTPSTPQTSDRRVAFQDEAADETDDLYRASPDPSKQQASATKSKWQPMAAVDPTPVADHDPFSLGDSDEDDSKKKEIKLEDAERLQKATAEAMADDLGSADKKAETAATVEDEAAKDKAETSKS